MEELVRRTQSPELHPHSILKRKTSRDDDTEERTITSPEPQGILKRKSNVSSSSSSGSGSPHVSISQTVIMNVAGISGTEFGADASEVVRPILKKKSSSEDTTTADSSSADTPKPILKKKTSTDVDDSEDRPKKPILKSSQRSSQEGRGSVSLDGTPRESPTRCLKLRSHSATASDSTSGSDGEAVRPILKQSNSRERSSSPRPRLSFCDDEDEDRLIAWSTASSGSDTTRPVSPVGEGAVLRRNLVLCSPVSLESERDNVVPKRRSWEPSSSVDATDNVQLMNRPNSDEPRSLSVAERIVNMESLLSQPVRSSSTAAIKTGAVPKRQGLGRSLRDKERFHTQPVTMDELEASALLASAHDFHRSLAGRGPSSRPNELVQANGDKVSSSTDESPSADTSVPDSLDDTLASTPSPAAESDKHLQHTLSPSPTMEGRQNSKVAEENEEKMSNEGASLTKSCSVSAMASLFARKQEDASRAGNSGVSRYRERRRLWAGESRVATQPVTQVEVEEAVRLNSQQSAQSDVPAVSSSAADDGNEDDPSKLSLSERIRLFNQKIKDEQTVKQPELGPRVTVKRTARFKTQPVTNEEVEIAQKKISNLAASFAKPPDPDKLGGLSIRAAREKIYEHAANILTKSSSASRLGQHSTSSRDVSPTRPQLGFPESETKPRGILKHSDSQKVEAVSSEEVTEQESENEVKGILKSSSVVGRIVKTPEPDSSRHLKSVLKKDTSTEERPSFSSTENLSMTGDYPKSILKPKPKEWVDESSSSSEDSGAASDSDCERPTVTSCKRGIDLISILHDVEAQARQQRQQASRPNTGEKIKNIKNLSQEKENQVFTCEQISDSQKKENSQKAIMDQQYLNQKLVSSTTVEENSRSNAMKQINTNNVNRKQVTTEVNRVHKHLHSDHRLSLDLNTSQTSDGETSSSGGREVKRIIRNEAVARRRQIAIIRQNRSGSSSQPAGEQLPPAGPALAKSRSQPCVQQAPATPPAPTAAPAPAGLQRSSTQPMAADLHHLSGASIADRLAALQKSGDTQWRKRISHLNPEDEITIIATKNQINELQAHHRDPDGDTGSATASPGSILADRLGKLDAATQGWRKRVGPTDADCFSVAGRMRMRGGAGEAIHSLPLQPSLPPQLQGGSPSEKAARRVPRALRFRSKAAQVKNASSTPTSPQKESPVNLSFKRSLSAPGGDDENGLSLAGREDEPTGPTVAVPRADDETFLQFFRSVSTEKLQSDRLEIRDEDLNEIIADSTQLLVQKKSVKVQRRNITSRNPLKVLAARTDLQEEYVEVKTGIAEKEIRRLNVEKLAKSSPLAVEALAGLASKEDFTAVALKKASSSVGSLLPYKDLMLIHVKGRRHVQSRLVEPTVASVNHGDNYVLVTPTEVFNWVGLYSNVIERSRGAEIAQYIVQKKDLGYTGSGQVITITKEKITCSTSQKKRFWQLLGAQENIGEGTPAYAGHPDEDELYENCILATNKVYELQEHELVPMEEYWGSIPRIQMLDPSKIIVFDFGSEMYIWNGKNASLDTRREAIHLARELWSEGYDYTGCDVCPLTISAALGSHLEQNVSTPVSGPERPSWALLGKVTQHMETILFREKFLDWPDFSRVIRSKVTDDIDKQFDATIDVKPCDAKMMTESKQSEPDLELEGLHLGRGCNYFDQEMRRHYEITTLGVTVWHIQEYEHSELPRSSLGQFHMGDSYVIRWQYSITVTGRELSGQPSRHSVAGRDRCAYFCWQGQDASLNEQGAAALLTVELDHERGPQVRVVQGYEPPAFLALFQGSMVTHIGRRGDMDFQGPWRLFVCRGELAQEAVLVEVTCSIRQLRNRGCFVLLNTSTGAIHVWYGKKSPTHARKVAKSAAERIQDRRPPEIGFKASANLVIYEQQEGAENKEFFKGLGGSSRQLYTSVQANGTPRLFHLSSISGFLSTTEILSPYRHPDFPVAFPFLQDDLYSAGQPALFLLDSGSELWLWQGWWPDTTEDPSTQTGSGAVRWQAERRAAMQTALDYAHHMGRRRASAWLVWAGLEPLEFTNLFPVWTDRDDIAELNIRDGRKPGEVLTVEDELARLTCSTYPPAQLLQRPLPDGVDPTCLEIYLDPNHFQELLGMSKEEFSSLPLWKQTKLKKDVGLF
ncbi:supervillin [Schistocerca serialis cubense]|uniref:supervillin n=1 Tax=Schistocerca serialis cubense TaxID=2023355 RepID=UPI00214EC5A7|nr:supervillin [Schistocerca serialis cubense]